jgi:hypothetical protein
VVEDGVSYRTRLEASLRRAKTPARRAEIEAELYGPPFPPELAYLWKIFGRLSSRRGSNGFGPLPIGWSDLDAFSRMSQTKLQPWEIEIIEDLDALYLAGPPKPEPEGQS